VVFDEVDPSLPGRRLAAVLSGLSVVGAMASAFQGLGREPVILLVLAAIVLAVMALPTSPDPEEAVHKRSKLVVTQHGFIMRDGCGLRTWRFDELLEARRYLGAHRSGLLLVRRDGVREFLDVMSFHRNEHLADAIRDRLKNRAV
jgi:hypothetical protein